MARNTAAPAARIQPPIQRDVKDRTLDRISDFPLADPSPDGAFGGAQTAALAQWAEACVIGAAERHRSTPLPGREWDPLCRARLKERRPAMLHGWRDRAPLACGFVGAHLESEELR